MLEKVLLLKISRLQNEVKLLESKIDDGTASGMHKQEFIRLGAKIEAYQDILDMVVIG
jgi:hypothetical protein